MGESQISRYEIPAHVLARSVGADTVLLDLHQDEYFSLDRVGTEIWTMLQAGSSVADIVSHIAAAYEVETETVTNDVRNLLDELVRGGLIIDSAASA